MRLLGILTAVILFIFSLSCGQSKIRYGAESMKMTEVEKGAGLEIRVVWVKNKGEHLDMELFMRNTSAEYIRLGASSFKIRLGTEEGVAESAGLLRHLSILTPGSSARGIVYFRFQGKAPGPGTAYLTIDPKFSYKEDPSIEEYPRRQSKRAIAPIELPLSVN